MEIWTEARVSALSLMLDPDMKQNESTQTGKLVQWHCGTRTQSHMLRPHLMQGMQVCCLQLPSR